MRPRKRYLGGNAGTEAPTNLLFFDTESLTPKQIPFGRGRELSLRLWVAMTARRVGHKFTRQEVYRGKTAEEFWNLIEHKLSWHRPLWAFAHNLGYDLTQLEFWRELESKRFTAGPVPLPPSPKTGKPRAPWRGRLVLEGRPTFLVLRHAKGILKLVDTGNYWPEKLEAIGQKHSLPKLPLPAWEESDETWFEYCTRDVNVVRVAVCELVRWWLKEDCGVFKMTAAALAMQNFKHTCKARTADGKGPNIVLEDESPARPLERAAYLGARVEAFYVGRIAGPVYELDMNRAYLAAMSGNLFPRARVKRLLNPTPDRLHKLMGTFGAIADVQVHSRNDGDTFPVKRYGLQLHCAGTFWCTLCGPELYRALDSGCVRAVGECHLYSLCELFKGWADYWYHRGLEAKRDDDLGQYEFCKLVGNSLVGKFAQRGEWWVDAPERIARREWGYAYRDNAVTGKYIVYRYIGGHTQKKIRGEEPAQAFPAISAYVTAYARENLRRAMRVCPKESVLYTATDSLLVTEKGFQALDRGGLVHPEALGHFRIEGVHADGEICGTNWYRLGDKWTCAGLQGKAVHGANGELLCEVWQQLPAILSRRPGPTVTVETVELRTMQPADKNLPAGNGWRKPLWLSPEDEFTDRPSRFVRWPQKRE